MSFRGTAFARRSLRTAAKGAKQMRSDWHSVCGCRPWGRLLLLSFSGYFTCGKSWLQIPFAHGASSGDGVHDAAEGHAFSVGADSHLKSPIGGFHFRCEPATLHRHANMHHEPSLTSFRLARISFFSRTAPAVRGTKK